MILFRAIHYTLYTNILALFLTGERDSPDCDRGGLNPAALGGLPPQAEQQHAGPDGRDGPVRLAQPEAGQEHLDPRHLHRRGQGAQGAHVPRLARVAKGIQVTKYIPSTVCFFGFPQSQYLSILK